MRPRGEVGEIAGGAGKQAHHLDGLIGGDAQPPLAGAVAEHAGELHRAVFGHAFLEIPSRQRRGLAGRHGEGHRSGAAGAAVVDAGDGHRGVRGTRIDDPQPAHLVGVAGRIEGDHFADAVNEGREVVHAGDETVGRANVGERLDRHVRAQLQTPVHRAWPHAAGNALGGVAER